MRGTLQSMIRECGTAAILLALLATQSEVAIASDTERLTPDQIYWRAQAAVNRLPQPAYIAFTFENQGFAYDGHSMSPPRELPASGELLRVLVRTSDGRAAICAFKDQRGRDVPHPSVGIVSDEIGWIVVTNIVRLGRFSARGFWLTVRHGIAPRLLRSVRAVTTSISPPGYRTRRRADAAALPNRRPR